MTVTINGTTGISGVDGSAATPALQGGDTNTGIVFGTDTVGVSTGGVQRTTVDSSGRLLAGTSSARTDFFNGGFGARVLSERAGGLNGSYAHYAAVNNENNDEGAIILLGKSRGTTLGSVTVVQSGDVLGTIEFEGADGTDLVPAARIQAFVDGTPGNNDLPCRLTFSTTADGASSPTERLRIGNAGGIDVSATGNADNYLRNTAGQTTASGANMFIDGTSGVLRRSTSSIKYKTDVETLQDFYADEILKCRPVWYRSTSAYDNQQWGHWGFIAEEVAEIDPRLCFYGENEDGSLEPEGVQYDRFVPHLLNLIKRQQQAIEDLQAEVAALKAQ